jgi:spore coat protein H
MMDRIKISFCLAPWRNRLAILALVGGTGLAMTMAHAGTLPQHPAELYRLTNVWSVHLHFTAEQWDAMEPTGGPGAGGRMGGFGGPVGPPDQLRPTGFGPGMFLAPALLRQGDQNKDGKLSAQEFNSLAETWFAAWDKTRTGQLNEEQLREGLNATFGDAPGPGPAGGRPPRMGLQGQEGKRNGLASAMGIEFNYVHGDLEFEGVRFSDVAVRYKGNGTFLQSRGSLKRSFKLELNKYTKGQKLAGITRLNLHNNVTDPSWMNEVLSYRLYRDAGVPAPRTAYARVYVTVAGKFDRQYFGLYSLVEDVDKSFAEENFGTKKGAILKPVTPDLFADLGRDWERYRQTYDPKTDVSDAATVRLMEFCRLVSSANDAEFATKFGNYVDLAEFARVMSVMVYLSDMDGILGPGQNLYLFLSPRNSKLSFVPWDQDHSFGQFGMRGSQEQRENLSLQKPWDGENRFLERVYRVDAFRKLYTARLAEFSQSLFRPERFVQQVDELGVAIRPAVKEESETKLEAFDRALSGEPLTPEGFGPFSRQRPAPQEGRAAPGFGGGAGGPFQPMKSIKGFVKVRSQSVADQVAGKSEGQTIGGFSPGGPPGGRPGGFGPGMFLAGVFMRALDSNKDHEVTRDEFLKGFHRWFEAWATGDKTELTPDQLRAGINRDLDPMRDSAGGGLDSGQPGRPPPGS